MNWITRDNGRADHPMPDPAAAANRFAESRAVDPVTGLAGLSGRLDELKTAISHDQTARNHDLSLIQEAGYAYVSALLEQYLSRCAEKQPTREADWNALVNYQKTLTAALCASARLVLNQATADPSLRQLAAAAAARSLDACRTLAKICLIRYLSVPSKLWQLAYAIHGDAEKADCASTGVCMHASRKTLTSVTRELLRLLMLQSSAPDMMAPEQIEVADRVIAQLEGDLTLRPRGAADSPFCFAPASDCPPCRAGNQQQERKDAEIRYFGPGAGFNTLQRLYKQVATAATADIPAFGKDIAAHEQVSAIQHLLAFWSATSPYLPPVRSEAKGTLRIVHRYGGIWQHLSRARSGAIELTLAQDDDDAPQAPETWTLLDAGGNELGVEIAQQSCNLTRCGDIVGALMRGEDECWLGVVRSMHAELGRSLRANIAILNREPQAVQLRVLVGKDEENLYTEETARQFGFNLVRAIILPADSDLSPNSTVLLPPESWKEGRVYEVTGEEPARYLRGVRLMRRGHDYVRAIFEWVSMEQA
jgi:hypothetical protein